MKMQYVVKPCFAVGENSGTYIFSGIAKQLMDQFTQLIVSFRIATGPKPLIPTTM